MNSYCCFSNLSILVYSVFLLFKHKLSLQRLKHALMKMNVAISSSILTFGSSDV